MPTKIYLKGGANVLVKGDTKRTAIYYGAPVLRWLRRTARAVAMGGHELEFHKRDLLCLEFQPDAEYEAQEAARRKAAEEAANASHCRRCGSTWPREHDYCGKCSAPLTKKEPPSRLVPGS